MNETAGFIMSIVIMLAMFYLLVFIPENRRKKKYNVMLNSLKLNDEIMTKGGIIGKITSIKRIAYCFRQALIELESRCQRTVFLML